MLLVLGGLNFKGFDYKGIGPYDGNIYLGGNEFFTSTIRIWQLIYYLMKKIILI